MNTQRGFVKVAYVVLSGCLHPGGIENPAASESQQLQAGVEGLGGSWRATSLQSMIERQRSWLH